ncbi:tripartite tricarboxylate transporter permease [Epibacterium ulvae]|uniref:tripartite tricarboxylate transporter permease n=1 Tax=Epibacterium ulvae TaxID=1156985 RepID=UPI001BFC4009|nr:tripartite tricarboxylate transporter permease [Epibacterium ulvae]MBT8155588.1 tripartite tricarboxylate transporter permease [Epibacterium ulvae]
MSVAAEVLPILMAGLPLIALGVALGVVAGALPGFGASNTLIILFPLTLTMEVNSALIMMTGLFVGVRFGGAMPAILINVPGTASGAVTALEGFPMSKKGLASMALGVALLASVVGSFASGLIAITAAPLIARLALEFGAPEIFALAVFSIIMVGQIAGDDRFKGWFAGAAGLLIGSVGVDPMWGTERGTFGFFELYDGIPVIAALVGLYAVAEVMEMAQAERHRMVDALETVRIGFAERAKGIFSGARYAIRKPADLLRSTAIGSLIGALPGAGANIASFLSYQQAITFSPNAADQAQFGKGNPRGIVASESADNACASGALVPMMSLGIPGSSSTAVLLLVMSAHGLNVGPRLFVENTVSAYAMLGAIPLAALLLIVLGFGASFVASRLAQIPRPVIATVITIFALAGAYAARYMMFDVYLALGFGLLGYVMRREGYPPQAMLIGIILAPVVEANFFVGLRMGFGSPDIFFTRPVSMAIWMIMIASIFYIARKQKLARDRIETEAR